MTKDQILAEAAKLQPEEMEQLADAFWRVAHGATREEIEAEWAIEIRRRVDALERGDVAPLASDDVVARLRNKKAS